MTEKDSKTTNTDSSLKPGETPEDTMARRTTKTITVSLPPKMADKVERLAKAEKKSKSQLFRDMFAVYEEYVTEKEWQELFRYGKETAKKLGIASEEDIERIVDEVRAELLEKEK